MAEVNERELLEEILRYLKLFECNSIMNINGISNDVDVNLMNTNIYLVVELYSKFKPLNGENYLYGLKDKELAKAITSRYQNIISKDTYHSKYDYEMDKLFFEYINIIYSGDSKDEIEKRCNDLLLSGKYHVELDDICNTVYKEIKTRINRTMAMYFDECIRMKFSNKMISVNNQSGIDATFECITNKLNRLRG